MTPSSSPDAAGYIRNSNRIPVFVISRDWFTPLRDLVQWLEDEAMENVHIVDNASTYPPLLEYLERTPHNVIRLGGNFGHRSPWECGLIERYAKDSPYIVTDSDVVPHTGSHGAVARFAHLLNMFPGFYKMGFGLRIDDIPDVYAAKRAVLDQQTYYWTRPVLPHLYLAPIDTTFALYRENSPYVRSPAMRTGGRFVAQHRPWYIDSRNPSDEAAFYVSHAESRYSTWGRHSIASPREADERATDQDRLRGPMRPETTEISNT